MLYHGVSGGGARVVYYAMLDHGVDKGGARALGCGLGCVVSTKTAHTTSVNSLHTYETRLITTECGIACLINFTTLLSVA